MHTSPKEYDSSVVLGLDAGSRLLHAGLLDLTEKLRAKHVDHGRKCCKHQDHKDPRCEDREGFCRLGTKITHEGCRGCGSGADEAEDRPAQEEEYCCDSGNCHHLDNDFSLAVHAAVVDFVCHLNIPPFYMVNSYQLYYTTLGIKMQIFAYI